MSDLKSMNIDLEPEEGGAKSKSCLLYTSPSPRDRG